MQPPHLPGQVVNVGSFTVRTGHCTPDSYGQVSPGARPAPVRPADIPLCCWGTAAARYSGSQPGTVQSPATATTRSEAQPSGSGWARRVHTMEVLKGSPRHWRGPGLGCSALGGAGARPGHSQCISAARRPLARLQSRRPPCSLCKCLLPWQPVSRRVKNPWHAMKAPGKGKKISHLKHEKGDKKCHLVLAEHGGVRAAGAAETVYGWCCWAWCAPACSWHAAPTVPSGRGLLLPPSTQLDTGGHGPACRWGDLPPAAQLQASPARTTGACSPSRR